MKNRYFILSVLFWAVASVCMAISLPSSSYNAYETNNLEESYTLGIGTSFNNTFLTSASVDARGTCYADKQSPTVIEDCELCCIPSVLMPCVQAGGTEESCGPAYKECINSCIGTSLPLGTPLLLLPFALVYAIVRRKRTIIE